MVSATVARARYCFFKVPIIVFWREVAEGEEKSDPMKCPLPTVHAMLRIEFYKDGNEIHNGEGLNLLCVLNIFMANILPLFPLVPCIPKGCDSHVE